MRPNRSISYGELKEAFGRDALLYESITDILIYLEQIIEIRINVDDRSDDCDYFQYFHHCKRLKRFFLVDENQSFSVKDGVLYSKDGKELLWFPQNKDIRHFEVPQVVEQIAWLESNKVKSLVLPDSLIDMRIFNCQNLTTIALGKNCRIPSNPPHFCQECPNLLNVKVNPKHPTLTAKDGVLFDKNLSRIIRYPTKKSHSGAYITPPGVTRIANFAFADAKFSYFSYSDDITGVPLHDFFSGYKYLQEHQMVVGVIDFNHHIKTIHFGSSSSDIKPCYLKNLHVSTIEVAEINPKYKAIDGMLVDRLSKTLVRVAPTHNKETISISNKIEAIGECSFANCELNNIILPTSITAIQASAFENCIAENLIIPASVYFIHPLAFNGSAIHNVEFKMTQEKANKFFSNSINVFGNGTHVKFARAK